MVEDEPLSSEAASLSDYTQSKKSRGERYLRNGAQRQPDDQGPREDYDGVPLALPLPRDPITIINLSLTSIVTEVWPLI